MSSDEIKEGEETSNVVWADPYSCLPFRSDKYAGNCTDMHLGGRNLTGLRDFLAFKSLCVLWINNNKLTSFAGLESNFRIKELYAHENKIQTLGEQCFSHMTFLNTLTLNGNKLDNLENVIEELRPMRNLQILELFDNPLAQEDNYRLRMIGELENLTSLDRHAITEEEREQAREFMKKFAAMANFSLTKKKIVIPRFSPEESLRRQQTYESIVERFKDKTFRFRIALEKYFTLHDKRHLGKVTEQKFWEVLDETNLTQLLEDDFEREVLADKYRVKVDVPAVGETGFIRKQLMFYRKLCEDVLRPEIRLYPDETWRPDLAPEISIGTMDLTKYVKEVKEKTIRMEETKQRELLAATRAAATGGSEVFGDRLAGKKHKCQEHGLTEFIAGELIKIISSFSGGKVDNKKQLTQEQAESILKKMSYFGVAPVLGVKGATEALFCGGSKTSISALELKDALGASVASLSAESIKIFWRPLTAADKEKLAGRLFGDAGTLLDSLLRMGPADNTKELLEKTTLTSIHATRLRSDVKREAQVPAFVTPAEAIQKASNRADVIILPNLLPDLAKEEKKKEELAKADWSQHLAKLGLKGEFLSVAIERKNRSILKQAALRNEKEELKRKMATSLSAPDLKGKPQRKQLVPPSDGGPKGWASSTGNVVIG